MEREGGAMIRDSRTFAAFLMGLTVALLAGVGREGWIYAVLLIGVPWDKLGRYLGPICAEGWRRIEQHRWEKKQAKLISIGRER
jgi:hypothetical protein